MIYTVDKAHINRISGLVPGEILSSAGVPGVYFLGAFDEAMNKRPVAAASFTASCPEKSDGAETFFLNWLFVKEEERMNGIGSDILKTVRDIAERSGAKQMIVKFPDDNEETKLFFEKRGFDFTKSKRTVLKKTLGECDLVPLLNGKPDPNVRSFRDILLNDKSLILSLPDCDVRELLAACAGGKSFGFDDELGCAYTEDRRICAALIVNNADPSTVEIAKLKVFQGFRPQMIIELLQFCLHCADNKYVKETGILVKAENESSRLLLNKLFPDALTRDIMVGRLEF